MMRMLNHPNIIQLHYFFYSSGTKKEEIYLNLVLEFVPETVYQVTRSFSRRKEHVPPLHVKVGRGRRGSALEGGSAVCPHRPSPCRPSIRTQLYAYQMFRALAYIHGKGICHRDIKPHNLLVDPATGVLKLCDFGSAKILVPDQPNVSYICSRCVMKMRARAPPLRLRLCFGPCVRLTARCAAQVLPGA